MKKNIAIGILTLLLFIASCSSRKVKSVKEASKNNVTEKAVIHDKDDSSMNVRRETAVSVSDDGQTTTETLTITPLDPNKEATMKDAQGLLITMSNAVYRLERMIAKKKYDLKEEIKENKAVQIKRTSNASTEKHAKESKEAYVKESDKKVSLLPWHIFISLLVLCGAAGYIYYKANPTSRLFSLFKRH